MRIQKGNLKIEGRGVRRIATKATVIAVVVSSLATGFKISTGFEMMVVGGRGVLA